MDELERELADALRREAAPAGFAERVLAKAKRDRHRGRGWWRARGLRWAAAGALLGALILGGAAEYRRVERARGERAREQALLALRIIGSRLRVVQSQIAKRDSGRGENP